ncbi:hypothetical protein V6767_20400 [Martelella sp. FLE1502]
MLMTGMIERVARAIAGKMHEDGDYGMTGNDAYERRPEEFNALARAAIEAMREPTPAMCEAGETGLAANGVDDVNETDAPECWKAMITAALQEERE